MGRLSNRLLGVMRERGLTPGVLARELGVERSYMSRVVAGMCQPNPSFVRRLARKIGNAPEEWLRDIQTDSEETQESLEFPLDFTRVAAVLDVPEGEMTIVLDGRVALACVDGEIHAFGNVCPHAGGPIGEGFLDGCIVECPWHAGRWDIRSGEALTLIATADIPVFEVRKNASAIEIRKKAVASGSAGENQPT